MREYLVAALRQWTRDHVAPAFPAQYLTDVNGGALVKIGAAVFEVKVVQRKNLTTRSNARA